MISPRLFFTVLIYTHRSQLILLLNPTHLHTLSFLLSLFCFHHSYTFQLLVLPGLALRNTPWQTNRQVLYVTYQDTTTISLVILSSPGSHLFACLKFLCGILWLNDHLLSAWCPTHTWLTNFGDHQHLSLTDLIFTTSLFTFPSLYTHHSA